jgi:hypothetical protein
MRWLQRSLLPALERIYRWFYADEGREGMNANRSRVLRSLWASLSESIFSRKLQSAIDRRFYRSKYDAEQALEKFRSGLRAEVNPDELCSQLIQVV